MIRTEFLDKLLEINKVSRILKVIEELRIASTRSNTGQEKQDEIDQIEGPGLS